MDSRGGEGQVHGTVEASAWIESNKSFTLFLRPFKPPALVFLMYFSECVICNKVKVKAMEHGAPDCLHKG